MSQLNQAEYEALRATIRERGTLRLWLVFLGFTAWGAVLAGVSTAGAPVPLSFVPLVVLAASYETSFLIHSAVERIGRYIQVFWEEAAGSPGWETTAMSYGEKFRGGPDPLFGALFHTANAVNFIASLTSLSQPGWIAVSIAAHAAFAYRVITTRRAAAVQRALDLERFRALSRS